MASDRDLALLAHGVKIWNATVRVFGYGKSDLTGARLYRARLNRIDLRGADLSGADLRFAKLRDADLTHARFDGADLSGAVLDRVLARHASFKNATMVGVSSCNSEFEHAQFEGTDLTDATCELSKFRRAIFLSASLVRTRLTGADLTECVFYFSSMTETVLSNADMTGAFFGNMLISDVDFSRTVGIAHVHHRAASFVGLGTLRLARTTETFAFLKRCGLNPLELAFGALWKPDLESSEILDITYDIARQRTVGPIMLSPLFISHSHKDRLFVEQLASALEQCGMPCWLDVKDLTVGRIDTQIDRAIRLNPIVLLILSKASVRSDWVAWEAARARRLEQEIGRDVLCPIALDDSWRDCEWPGPLRQQVEAYHLLDFSNWGEAPTFQRQFTKLREGLRLYYNKRT